MRKAKCGRLKENVRPPFDHLAWHELFRQVGLEGLVNEVGLERVLSAVERLTIARSMPASTGSATPRTAPAMPEASPDVCRKKTAKREGLTVNVRPLFEYLGWQEILRQVGLASLIAQLSSKQRQELLRLLQRPPDTEGRRR